MSNINKHLYSPEEIRDIIRQGKILAKKYQVITGKPLGITGEVGEYEAARILGLELTDARTPGFDAIREANRKVEKIQIKSRRVIDLKSRGQRIGSIRLNHEWDIVLLVLLDEDFEPLKIYEAERKMVEQELQRPGSKSRNERGALGVRKFVSISKKVWEKEMITMNHQNNEEIITGIRAVDLLNHGKSAICVFCHGDYLDIPEGSTGYWKVNPEDVDKVDKVIVYHRDGDINRLYIGDFSHTSRAPAEWLDRYTLFVTSSFQDVGTTELNWFEFMGNKWRNPVQKIKKD
jgi:hypothetical protein